MATRFLKDLPRDLDRKISRDFNNLIKDVHFELSNRNETQPTKCLYLQDSLLLVGKHKIVQ